MLTTEVTDYEAQIAKLEFQNAMLTEAKEAKEINAAARPSGGGGGSGGNISMKQRLEQTTKRSEGYLAAIHQLQTQATKRVEQTRRLMGIFTRATDEAASSLDFVSNKQFGESHKIHKAMCEMTKEPSTIDDELRYIQRQIIYIYGKTSVANTESSPVGVGVEQDTKTNHIANELYYSRLVGHKPVLPTETGRNIKATGTKLGKELASNYKNMYMYVDRYAHAYTHTR